MLNPLLSLQGGEVHDRADHLEGQQPLPPGPRSRAGGPVRGRDDDPRAQGGAAHREGRGEHPEPAGEWVLSIDQSG